MDKQCTVEHDRLIHEYEKLTTDLDGLLGVLEDALQEYGREANFEAKKLLCALFQVYLYIDVIYNMAVAYCIYICKTVGML